MRRVPVTRHLVSSVLDTVDAIDHRRIRYGRDLIKLTPAGDLSKHCTMDAAFAHFRVAPSDLQCEKNMLKQISSLKKVCLHSKPRPFALVALFISTPRVCPKSVVMSM